MHIFACRNCSQPLERSENTEYTFQCKNCDEDFYHFEAVIKEAIPVVMCPEDVIKCYEDLLKEALMKCIRVKLNPQATNDLTLYYHQDYPSCILVDKSISGGL